MKQLKFVWLLVVLLALAACGKQEVPAAFIPTATPTIISDKEDYAPGELVTLTGSNWQPGESVQIVVDDDGIYEYRWQRDVTVSADDDGNIIDKFNLPDWFVADYTVTATGVSGRATTTFTDGNVSAETSGPTVTLNYRQFADKSCSPNPGTSGSASITSTSGSTTLFGQDRGSFRLEVPATTGNQVFSHWTAQSGFSSTANPLCFDAVSANRTFKAHYVAAPAVSTSISDVSGSGTYGGNGTLTAKLSAGGTNLSGKTVEFKLNSTDVGNATTNSLGVATLSGVSLTGINAGTYANAVSARFAGDSSYSTSNATGSLTVSKAAGSVSISNIPNSATVGRNFTPTYTKAGDGTTSTISNTTNICTVTTGVVNFVAAGDCRLRASVAEGSNHLAATGTEQTFTVAAPPKQNQEITFAQPTSPQTYDATFNVNPTASSGLAVTVTASGDVCTATPATAPATGYNVKMTSGSGTCTLTASQAGNDSYNAATEVVRTVAASKANQTINFGTLGDKTYGDPSFSLSATGGASGKPVTFVAADQCRMLENNSVSIDGAGSCTITASQEGNDNYNAAANVSQTFTIARADQTITWSRPAAFTYGTALSGTQLNASTNGGGSLTYTPAAGAVLDAGTRTLRVEAAETANYKAAFATVTLEVTRASLTVTASNQTVVYGTSPDDFTVSYAGFVNNENATVLGGDLRFTGAGTNAGTYTITPAGLTSNNYAISFVAGQLTITKAPSITTVTVSNGTFNGQQQGGSATVTGAGGLNQSVAINYTGRNGTTYSSTTPPSDAGDYTATATYAESANHTGSSDSKNFSIAKANQTISLTGAPSTAVFGSKFTVSATGGASGKTVVLGASGACTISGTEVTMTSGSDTCNVTADQDGNDNYNAAPQAKQATAAQKANQTISWNNPAAISFGTPLSATQLNASLTTGDGNLSYSPAAGTVLSAATHTLTVNASGTNNYNATSAQVSITVNPWAFGGWQQPLVSLPTRNTVKAGRAIPVKFSLGGDQGLSIFNGPAPKSSNISCTPAGTDPVEDTLSAGSSSLSYDATTGLYTYVWKSESSWAGKCRVFELNLKDGSAHKIEFVFTK